MCGCAYDVAGREAVCSCVPGFPKSRTAVRVSGSSRGSHVLLMHEFGLDNAHPLGRKMWNQGQSSFLIGPAAGSEAGSGSMGNIHW